METIE